MSSAVALRFQIESALAHRIPSALTPPVRTMRPVSPTGIDSIDEILEGGLPLGALTEIVGTECSGRTGLALSFVAQLTQMGKVCAWVDVSDNLHPESAAAIGVDLSRLLWVRCGIPPTRTVQPPSDRNFALPEKYFVPPPVKKGLHGGGFGPHPRNEIKGISEAVSGFLNPGILAPQRAEPQPRINNERATIDPEYSRQIAPVKKTVISGKPWSRLDQALQVTDLLLHAGGFSAIVFDMGSIAAKFALRVPLATWFRYRASAERSQSAMLMLSQQACAKSSAGLVLRLQTGKAIADEKTVFTGLEYRAEVARERFKPVFHNVVAMRKQPQSERRGGWVSRTSWAGCR